MTKFYSLKVSLNANGVNQAELIQHFQSNGDEVIQTSDGLCLKTTKTQSAVESFLEEKNATGVLVTPVSGSS
ncbi:MAG: hypothetical protein V4692_04370, partial [Bdellovibrionota bacterium]